MKKLRLLLLLFSPTLVHAQMAQDWGAFQKSISVKAYQGKKFRLQAAVKVKHIDSTADAEIWARVDRENKKMGFLTKLKAIWLWIFLRNSFKVRVSLYFFNI